MNASQVALLKLHMTPRLGRVAIFKLQRGFGNFCNALEVSAQAWNHAGVPGSLFTQVPAENDPDFKKTREYLDRHEIKLISYWDTDYPDLLRQIHDPPALIYLRGHLPPNDCLGIVGSRRATQSGLATTRKLAATLAQHDICIVSGMARGIDSAAHRGALEADGRTIAVLGCGIDRIYPAENKHLFHDIIQNNAIISEYPPGTPPRANNFPGRNRIISGLSKGVLVVEAAEGSGSLITADFALEQGREIFSVPGSPHATNSKGTNRLLKEGALMVTETNDILEALWPGQLPRVEREQQRNFIDQLSDSAAEVYRFLGFDPVHIDEVARKCSLTPMELSAILLDLELQGGIKALPGNHYVRSRL